MARPRRSGGGARILLGVARSQRRASSVSLWLARLRERGLRDGFLGGNRVWMAIGILTWTMRVLHLATRRHPEVMYATRLRKGETITIVEHPAGWRPDRR
jgi:hypothetical protein